jgi:hypothetical protein
MSFLDDLPMKPRVTKMGNETMDDREFVVDHIRDHERVLAKFGRYEHNALESPEKSLAFRYWLSGTSVGPTARIRPCAGKADAIRAMSRNADSSRFFFYHIWIPHYAHILSDQLFYPKRSHQTSLNTLRMMR